MRVTGYVMIAIAVLCNILQVVVIWPKLPEVVASHFGPNGVADGWMPRDTFFRLQLGLQIGLPLFMIFTSRLTRMLPSSWVNVPHKEYWMAPERREATLDDQEGFLVFVAGLTSMFLVAVFQMTYDANVNNQGNLPLRYFVPVFVVYMVAVLVLTIRLVRRYNRVPSDITTS